MTGSSETRGKAERAAASGLGGSVACALFLAAGILTLVVPRAIAGGVPVLAACVALAAYVRGQPLRPLFWPAPFTFAVLAFLSFAVVSAAWAKNPADALSHAVAAVVLTLLAQVLATWIGTNRDWVLRGAPWFIIGFAIGAVYLLIETTTQQTILRTISAVVGHAKASLGDRVGGMTVRFSDLNRNATAANLLVWPVMLAIVLVWRGWRRYMLLALSGAGTVFATFASEHETSKLALIGSLGVFLLAWAISTVCRRLLLVGWIAAIASAVPLSLICHERLALDEATWLPSSAQHRIIIWGNIAERTLEQPLVGAGVRSIYSINLENERENRGASVLGLDAIPPHAHNVYLQVWFELGLLGAVLLASIGVAFARAVSTLDHRVHAFFAAMAATAMVEIFSSWELWQGWFFALLSYTAVVAVFAATLAVSRTGPSSD